MNYTISQRIVLRLKSFIPIYLKVLIAKISDKNLARKKDIYYCYRLILGRKPKQFEIQPYINAVKFGILKVNQLSLSFLSSTEFKQKSAVNLFSIPETVLVQLPHFNIQVSPPDSSIGKSIIDEKKYEYHVTKSIINFLKPNMTFVDIGANIGYFSLLAAKITGTSGKVFSFEPSQFNCRLLYKNATLNNFDNIEIFPVAVADKKQLVFYNENMGNGMISFGDTAQLNNATTLLRTVTLDNILAEVNKIDAIKLDIEGAEYLALRGAENLLKKHRPIIFSEVSPEALKNVSQVTTLEYLNFLINLQYNISVLKFNGTVVPCRTDTDKIMRYVNKSYCDHIDILALPA